MSRSLPWSRDWLAWVLAWCAAALLSVSFDARAQSSSCCTAAEWELMGITAEQIAYAFAWGFGSVVLFWSLGYAVGVALGLLKKL